MRKLALIFSVYCFLFADMSLFSQVKISEQITYNKKSYDIYPKRFESLPEIPSPFISDEGEEVIIACTKDKKYSFIPVTVENGKPMNYIENQWDKGKQLYVDAVDFPALAKTGLHSEKELDQTKTITGKSVFEISEDARPGRLSGAGFISNDEDIISVLKCDNRLVKKLGMTHLKLAKPLFHVFNIILVHLHCYRNKKVTTMDDISHIFYNGNRISVKWSGKKGWQKSIFNDEILGYYQINVERELNEDEREFINKNYSGQNTELIKMLSKIHTGEMVPYYIMRYGFYEGHTSYRADPLAIAFIFGLMSIEEIEKKFKGRIYEVLTEHYTEKNSF